MATVVVTKSSLNVISGGSGTATTGFTGVVMTNTSTQYALFQYVNTVSSTGITIAVGSSGAFAASVSATQDTIQSITVPPSSGVTITIGGLSTAVIRYWWTILGNS